MLKLVIFIYSQNITLLFNCLVFIILNEPMISFIKFVKLVSDSVVLTGMLEKSKDE